MILEYERNTIACREVLLCNHGRAPECIGLNDVKREIEFQERLRSQMKFGNERNSNSQPFSCKHVNYCRQGEAEHYQLPVSLL